MAIQITKQVQKNSFISYILSDQVWWCNIKWVLSYSKNYICKFMQANLWNHKLFHFRFPFWIWKVWTGREKITKVWISLERKKLFRWNKNHFSKFLKAQHLKKKKFDKKYRTQALITVVSSSQYLKSDSHLPKKKKFSFVSMIALQKWWKVFFI